MSEPIAYRNGGWIPQSQLTIPVTDAGFMQGTTVAEQMRTCRGALFHSERHVQRLERSLAIVGVECGQSRHALLEAARQLVVHNHGLLHPDDDLGLSLFVTPGAYPGFGADPSGGPLLAMHTYPVAFAGFAAKYEAGERLAVVSVRQVPAACWPTELKCRSRMHYYLADREARRLDPLARALLLDQEGFVSEASTANVLAYRRAEGLVSPPRASILPGITIAVLEELAAACGIPWRERALRPDEVATADEALLCSTSPCLLPVTHLDGAPIGPGQPGPVYRKLLEAFNALVGLDIPDQARRFAVR